MVLRTLDCPWEMLRMVWYGMVREVEVMPMVRSLPEGLRIIPSQNKYQGLGNCGKNVKNSLTFFK